MAEFVKAASRISHRREGKSPLVSIGLVALLLATFEYRHNIRMLSTQYPDIRRSPLPAAVALLISAGYPGVDHYGFAAMTISF